MNDFVLFVGNGVNNIVSDYKWKNLIDDIIEFIEAVGQIDTDEKPFPLLYEEIWIKAVRENRCTEEALKKFIAEKVLYFKANIIHHQIINLGIHDIITTNYDHAIEYAGGENSSNIFNGGIIKESKFSIFRFNKVNNSKIWHIHGDLNVTNSILLGYEQYSGYLQHMRNFVQGNTGTSYKDRKFDNIEGRMNNAQFDNFSWIDLFFTKDIYIIGASLDFVEIDIWWLLTYRARQKFKCKSPINNEIHYYYPNVLAKKIKNKLALLNSTDVILHSERYDENNRIDYYRKVLDKIVKKNS